jgi:transcriptional regulator with GAF, ATPase, and Fis domain
VGAKSGPKTAFVQQRIRLEHPRLIVLTGPKKGEELVLDVARRVFTIGADDRNTIVLEGVADDHAELQVMTDNSGIRVTDRSGGQTRLNGRIVHEGVLEPGSTLALGDVELRLSDESDVTTVLPSTADHFGRARGASLPMREVFGVVEAIAPTDATVLLLGETGTGKDVLANAIHEASSRKDRGILPLDCGAIAPSLIEAELFGYERGAFTGADESREGAFERAKGGTLFLDEIGELPLDVQPKLLRAIDDREIRRVGGGSTISVDVRIVAATKRDLEEEVERGRFREDLYFRLAVVPIRMPPLRERRDDIPLLIDAFVAAFAERTGHRARIDPNEVNSLLAHDWPGNVRELKNTVERGLWLAATGDGVARFMLPTADNMFEGPSLEQTLVFDPERSFSEHKQGWEHDFERSYLGWLMARADGSISKAARLASMDRKHLRGLLRKHGLAKPPS